MKPSQECAGTYNIQGRAAQAKFGRGVRRGELSLIDQNSTSLRLGFVIPFSFCTLRENLIDIISIRLRLDLEISRQKTARPVPAWRNGPPLRCWLRVLT